MMSWMTPLLIAIQVLCAVTIIVLVLLQHGKGADMGAAFGSGASGSLFGATGAANFLSRCTAVAAGLFFVATLALAFTASHLRGPRSDASGVVPATGVVPPTPADPGKDAAKGAGKDAPKDVPAASSAPAPAKPADVPK